MKKIVNKLKYCLIISLVIICQLFTTMSYAADISNLESDLKTLNNNYQVLKAAEDLNDAQFDSWCNAMIDILNIGTDDNQSGTLGYEYGKTTALDRNSKIICYEKASDAMSQLRVGVYEIADLDNYLNTDKVLGIDWNKKEKERAEKFRTKLLNNFNVSGLGEVQKYIETSQLTYDSARDLIDSTFDFDNVNKMKAFKKNEINSYYKKYGYNYPTGKTAWISNIENAWAQTLEIKKSELKEYADNIISDSADKKQGASADDVNGLDEETQRKLIEYGAVYNHPDTATKKNSSDNKDDMDIDKTIKNADEFVSQKGEDGNPENNINTEDLKDFFNPLYNITLIIGIIVAVLVGAILGIKFLTGSVEQKADTKKLLIPYLAGCVAVFGAFGIWKLVVTILADL